MPASPHPAFGTPLPNGVELVLAEVRKHSGELPNAAISQRIVTGRLPRTRYGDKIWGHTFFAARASRGTQLFSDRKPSIPRDTAFFRIGSATPSQPLFVLISTTWHSFSNWGPVFNVFRKHDTRSRPANNAATNGLCPFVSVYASSD
jgi:hypothetical protein